MVNAANTGGVTGFGLDEMVNRAAGDFEIKRARRAFGGIATGDAKFTRSYNHSKVKFIIHAVGPVYRANATGRGCSTEDKDRLLASAYRSALARAGELGAATVGFCLLSAGVFRGDRPLTDLALVALRALAAAARTPVAEVSVFAYTEDEASALSAALALLGGGGGGAAGSGQATA